jgi:site-specific DNA-methyltransferase (adenine-specific)
MGKLSARIRRGSVLRARRANADAVTNHPTEKPVSILREMIESSSCLDDVILDPFAGSGSTLVAARMEGRRGIGIELDERYCEIAARRLSQMVLPLFAEAAD